MENKLNRVLYVEDECIGYSLLDIVGGSRLKGTNNDDSDYDRYIVYLPLLENYIFNPKKVKNINNGEKNTHYITLNQFYTALVNGDFRTLEILNGYKQNKHDYVNMYFKEILDELSTKDYLNFKTFEHLVKIFKATYLNNYKKKESCKSMGTTYEMVFSILNLIDNGQIELPLREHELIRSIKYEKDFFNNKKVELETKVSNSIDIFKKAIEVNSDVLLENFPELTNDEINEKRYILNKTILYLIEKIELNQKKKS